MTAIASSNELETSDQGVPRPLETEPTGLVTEPAEVSKEPPGVSQLDIDTALRASGLVMIETDRDKVSYTATEDEPVAPRVRRERRPPPPDLDQPLMQIETRTSENDTAPPR